MGNPFFKFKKFTVFHDKCGMKVGVDGVTLGAWANVENCKSVLDIGCGSGLIALMIAQRSEAEITAIDIEKESVLQAKENVEKSLWNNRIKVLHISLQDFSKENNALYDLIVSNPPYFSNSLKNSSQKQTLARHTETLPHQEIIDFAIKNLSQNGKLALILPVSEGKRFVESALKNGLYCSKETQLIPTINKVPKRVLLEFQKAQKVCKIEQLVIEQIRGVYTFEYKELVKDFYLNL